MKKLCFVTDNFVFFYLRWATLKGVLKPLFMYKVNVSGIPRYWTSILDTRGIWSICLCFSAENISLLFLAIETRLDVATFAVDIAWFWPDLQRKLVNLFLVKPPMLKTYVKVFEELNEIVIEPFFVKMFHFLCFGDFSVCLLFCFDFCVKLRALNIQISKQHKQEVTSFHFLVKLKSSPFFVTFVLNVEKDVKTLKEKRRKSVRRTHYFDSDRWRCR